MISEDSRPVPWDLCPLCGHPSDRVTSIESKTPEPVPGSLTICIDCGGVLMFDAAMCLVVPIGWEVSLSQRQRIEIASIQGFIRARGRLAQRENA